MMRIGVDQTATQKEYRGLKQDPLKIAQTQEECHSINPKNMQLRIGNQQHGATPACKHVEPLLV